MTSRQPGTTPPGTTEVTGATQTPDDGSHPAGPRWPLQVLPLALLIILGLAGLRGAVATPRWNGPVHRDGVGIGLALEVVLAILLVLTLRRRSAYLAAQRASQLAGQPAPFNAVAVKLRGLLTFVLGTGMVAVAVTVLVGLHLKLFTAKPGKARTPVPTAIPKPKVSPLPHAGSGSSFHIPLAALLYTLLVVVLVVAVLVSIWLSRRFRPAGVLRDDDFIAEDPEDLREAVESGRSALRTIDDARAAIIACYLAMENSLAERGTARGAADTPDELLARATQTGLVRGTAAARLTGLFYEARFSSHPLDRGQRDEAERALDELAAALDELAAADAAAGASSSSADAASDGAGGAGA